jgi:hypothetical protein
VLTTNLFAGQEYRKKEDPIQEQGEGGKYRFTRNGEGLAPGREVFLNGAT